MIRVSLAFAVLFLFGSIAQAEVTGSQLSAACMKLDNGTEPKCACMAEKFTDKLTNEENTYALAMLSLDETLLTPINGRFEDEKAKAVKAKIIPLMMDCLL